MIVMKFGGTSVGSAEMIKRVCKITKQQLARRPVVVVSALAGVTDLLINSTKSTVARTAEPRMLAEQIIKRHLEIMRELEVDAQLLDEEFAQLRDILQGISLIGELSPAILDLAMSFGERMSSKIIAAYFNSQKIKSKAYTGWEAGFVTDSNHMNAEIRPETYENIRKFLAGNDHTPIVTGFIAKSREGRITTLGRGGSDYTAAIIGAALLAEEIQIWTDVNGIMTTDPRMVSEAKSIRAISFDEACELSYFGAKVLHPKTIHAAVKRNIPIRVLNTYAPENSGTLVLPSLKQGSRFTAIACKRNITVVRICSARMLLAYGFLASIFDVFKRHRISVDVVSTSEVSVSMTLDSSEGLDEAIKELEGIGTVEVRGRRAVVCVVGSSMSENAAAPARIFACCHANGINVEMISQGASQINISFIVREEDVDKCVRLLHADLFGGDSQ